MQALTGETPLTVGGQTLTLDTRREETDLTAATQYVYEFLQAQGLSASFQPWEDQEEDCAGRNVIGEIKGVLRPEEIVLITAHLDNQADAPPVPGADDNASGSVGVMMAASSLSGYSFERTLRFVLFTGEEGRTCMLQRTFSLTNEWDDLGVSTNCASGTNVFCFRETAPMSFWRVRVLP
jgi:hypothetical protein